MTWRGGYHGDTFHPMSVCDPDGGMHSLWQGTLPEQLFVPEPPAGFDTEPDQAYLDVLAAAIESHADELAAVIVEPVVQGAGGMRFHHPGYLRALRELTEAHGVLLIFDEIATGFGRTGRLFAAEHAGVAPDVLCLGKALTGGYLTMAAALCTAEVAAGISRGEVPVLAHGPTFMGNPLSSAVANASLGLLADGSWADDVGRIERGLEVALEPARDLGSVVDVRVLGAIGVIQLDHPVDMAIATNVVTEHGVWLRPFRDLIYTMPPYISTDEDVSAIAEAMLAAAAKA
jgi:adenosylmethionine-8-amino-7-oxononanoate aminotransferase